MADLAPRNTRMDFTIEKSKNRPCHPRDDLRFSRPVQLGAKRIIPGMIAGTHPAHIVGRHQKTPPLRGFFYLYIYLAMQKHRKKNMLTASLFLDEYSAAAGKRR